MNQDTLQDQGLPPSISCGSVRRPWHDGKTGCCLKTLADRMHPGADAHAGPFAGINRDTVHDLLHNQAAQFLFGGVFVRFQIVRAGPYVCLSVSEGLGRLSG